MSELKDIFAKYYKEEIIQSSFQGTTDYTFPDNTKYPHRIEALAIDGKDILFSDGNKPFRVHTEGIDFSLPSPPHFDRFFRVTNYDASKKNVTIDFLQCGNGEVVDSNLEIGYGDDILLQLKGNLSTTGKRLAESLGFHDGDRWIVFLETFAGSDDNFRIHGLNARADINRINGKWKITRYAHINFPKRHSKFLEFEVSSLSDFHFVEESEAGAAAAVIDEMRKDNKTILQLWNKYSSIEARRAEEYSAGIGKIKYRVLGYPSRHTCRIMLYLNDSQASHIYSRKDLFLRSSLQIENGIDLYDVVSINRDSTICVSDKYESLPRSGELIISISGNVAVHKRRESAYKRLLNNPNLLQRDLIFAIEDKMESAVLKKPGHEPAITSRTRKFLKDKFGIDDVTADQKDAIEIALNTPDIAIIQGPPGTGKSTVIAAVADRLLEIAEKKGDRQNDKLILVSAFQNDTVEHIASKIYTLGLPTVKIGKEAQGNKAEDTVIDGMKNDMERAMDYYKDFAIPSLSSALSTQRDIFIKEHTLSSIEDAVDNILSQEDLGEEINEEWELYKIYDRNDERAFDRQLKAIDNLRSKSSDEYNKDGFKNIRRLIRNVELDDEDKTFLENAPVTDPDNAFLERLDGLKTKYRNRFLSSEEATGLGTLGMWFDKAIDVAYRKEQERPQDKNSYMYTTLATLLNEINGDKAYVRQSLTGYGEAIAATNQTAGSYELSRSHFEDVILEEAARSNPLDLLIPMMKADRRIILVGDQKQLPQLLEHDIEEKALEESHTAEEQAANRKTYQRSLFDIIFQNLSKGGITPTRFKTLTTQFRMHPVISNFISRIYYPEEGLKPGLPNMEAVKRHNLSLPWAKDKVAVFCDVPHSLGSETGRSKYRPAEAKRIISLLDEIYSDPASENLSVGVITFYSAQVDEICRQAAEAGYMQKSADNNYEVSEEYRFIGNSDNPREGLRIGTVDSFQGKEFDIVILSTVRSNEEKRDDDNVNRVFGFLTLKNRLNVAFSRAEDLIIVVGDAAMFSDDYAGEYVEGLHEFYKELTLGKYGNRIR